MVKKFDDLKAADFPGVDPTKFFEWWKEHIFLNETLGKYQDEDERILEWKIFGILAMIARRLKAIPQRRRCQRLQKAAGISKKMINNALKGL